jgi:hypothetical protein
LSSPGYGIGQYPPAQPAKVSIDRFRNTTYVNFGNTSQYHNNTLGGVGTGFHVITNLGAPSVLTKFRISTGSGHAERDPLVISIEGSNGGNLTEGSSWTILYNGSSGLTTNPGRETFGSFQLVSNIKLFNYYRLLTLAPRAITDCVQYSEVEFYGYLMNLC